MPFSVTHPIHCKLKCWDDLLRISEYVPGHTCMPGTEKGGAELLFLWSSADGALEEVRVLGANLVLSLTGLL